MYAKPRISRQGYERKLNFMRRPWVGKELVVLERKNKIILYFNCCGVIEVGIFATEDVAEGIADEVGIANHQVGTMMGVSVNPCEDSAVSNVVAEFSGVGGIQYISFVSIFDSCECRKMVCDYNNLFSIAFAY